MIIRLKDPEIIDADPLAQCRLDRKQYAEILTDVVRSTPEGMVLALNNEWGTGKTTFVKMWNQHLKIQGLFPVIVNLNIHTTIETEKRKTGI